MTNHCSEETREKMSKAKMGNKYALGSKSYLGKHLTEEAKEKISRAQTGKHHTEEARRKIGEAHEGEKNYNWKGGTTPENDRIRHSLEIKLWREAVFAKDNFTCQKCEQRGGRLVAHHIFNFATYLDLRFAIDNGITLCKKCHNDFHKKYGNKNNTKEQLNEFMERHPN